MKSILSVVKRDPKALLLTVAVVVAILAGVFYFVVPYVQGERFTDAAQSVDPADEEDFEAQEEEEEEEEAAADEKDGFKNEESGLVGFSSMDAGAPVDSVAAGALVDPNAAADPASCKTQEQIKPEELLPVDDASAKWAAQYPRGEGSVEGQNYLEAGTHIGMVSNSMRNANQQLRSELPNPQTAISPWQQSTIAPNQYQRPMEIGCDC